MAIKSKTICDKYNIPLLINDRIDVALAAKVDGVHLGQTDMPVEIARELLPPGSIIGLSCNNVDHVKDAVKKQVDYIGIGAVWGTQTKKLTSPIIGVRGVGAMLAELDGTGIKSVAIGELSSTLVSRFFLTFWIGGIKTSNLLRTLHGSVSSSGHALDGVAVVSEIVASPEPLVAAKKLHAIISQFHKNHLSPHPVNLIGSVGTSTTTPTQESILNGVALLMNEIRKANPLVHQVCHIIFYLTFTFSFLFR